MKSLYIGNYRDGFTGWCEASKVGILSLDAAGLNVVPRAIKLNNARPSVPPRILELEKQSSRGAEICIQHVLPHLFEYCGHFKQSILRFEFETDNLSCWASKIKNADSVWVCNTHLVEVCNKEKELNGKVKLVPHAVNTDKFLQSYEPLDIPQLKDSFVFYFVGEVIRRKNLVALIKAFHLEFGVNENVELVIKANLTGHTAESCKKHVETMCEEIKRNMKIYPKPEFYKQEVIITDWLSEEDLLRLHKTCDCYINPSFGESWNLECMDAVGLGNFVISNNIGGPADYLNDKDLLNSGMAHLIDNTKEPVFGMTSTFQDLQTSRENWWAIDIDGLRAAMRKCYENRHKKTGEPGLNQAMKFSYKNVGEIMKRVLENG